MSDMSDDRAVAHRTAPMARSPRRCRRRAGDAASRARPLGGAGGPGPRRRGAGRPVRGRRPAPAPGGARVGERGRRGLAHRRVDRHEDDGAWVTYVPATTCRCSAARGPPTGCTATSTRPTSRRLAAALGLKGTPTHEDGYWTLETDDGTLAGLRGRRRHLVVQLGHVELGRRLGEQQRCGHLGAPERRAECVDARPLPDPALAAQSTPTARLTRSCPEPAPFVPPADLPTEAEARTIALDLLRSLGVDVDDATVSVDGPYEDWYITVEPTVDGLPVSGLSHSVGVGSKGVIHSAGGTLGTPERAR